VPARIADGIVQGGADGAVGCFEISASVNECGRDIDVVAACGVVQRRLGLSGTGGRGVGVSTGVDQQVHDVRPLGEVPRPIRDDMECGAAAPSGYEPCPCESRVVSDETPHQVKIAAVHGDTQLNRRRRIPRDGASRSPVSHDDNDPRMCRLGNSDRP
jgi:hypothetical protein